ncbi:MAG: nickel-dependent lactate racemase [archaeon GB-1867-035]|nr:nickel-dependent lactate racemase [Candidatus Culexmicrobium profundum]
MQVKLPYGKGWILLNIKEAETVQSKETRSIKNPRRKLLESLNSPIESESLRKVVRKASKILIVTPDKTRAFPSKIILPPILEEIRRVNKDALIRILIATGLHKPHNRDEIIELLGKEIYHEYEVKCHDALNNSFLTNLNKHTSYSTPIIVNKEIYNHDIIIGLGLIEPHFFAGYSGGRKIILPGIAGEQAIYNNHCYKMIADPKSRYGILNGNPIHEDMIEFMKKTKLDFIVNVTLNKKFEVTGLFSGHPVKAHIEGVKVLEKEVKVKVKEKSDIVITTNGGYPLDRNLYQAVKGMATAELIVRNGGVIIIAAECKDGLGGHNEFYEIVSEAENPDEIINKIKAEEPIKDQWEAQILARIQKKASIIIISEMKRKIIEEMHMIASRNIYEALEEAEKIVKKARPKITIIPEGPYIIPQLNILN